MTWFQRWASGVLLGGLLLGRAWAGGSGLNVVVVVNQASSNSVQLGNYYCEQRQVPPQNVLRIQWSGGNVQWTNADFRARLLDPLLAMVAARQLTNQIDYVVLSMDIPYRVVQSGSATIDGSVSTTSALYYGFKTDYDRPSYSPASCNLPAASANSYAGSESVFRFNPPATATTNAFLAFLLTSSNLPLAQAIVDRGVACDGTFPPQTVYLAKSEDRLRKLRYWLFDHAIFNTRLLGRPWLQATNTETANGLGYLLGYQNGLQVFNIGTGVFAPGAMADNLTSYGGLLFEPNDHTSLLALLDAGATASYGTIVEPCAYFEKFPSPQVYFYQARGFSIGESYYQGLTNPYQGLLVGEPLAAPFAQPCSGGWLGLPAEPGLQGVTNLAVRFQAADARHPVQQVDLFVDGTFLRTLTNLPPWTNNLLSVTVNGYQADCEVPAGATLAAVASNLTYGLNRPALSNPARLVATTHGDRIELRSLDPARAGAQTTLAVQTAANGAGALTTGLWATGSHFLDTEATGVRSYVITNVPQLGDALELVALKTNGETVVVSVTNTVAGSTLADLAKALFSAVNAHPALHGADGLFADDINMHEDFPFTPYVYGDNDHSGEFNLRARAPGWAAARARAALRVSGALQVLPAGTNSLDENLTDLQPRAHLYVTAGVTDLPLSFDLDTTRLPDGVHELTAVAYEGSHVRTQRRASQTVRVRNGTLSANLRTLYGGSNTALGATLQFAVTASPNPISTIELFSTGGSLGCVSNQASATFAVPGSTLGLGRHPFYAVVTAKDGQPFRTETHWIRLVGAESGFPVSLTAPPPTLVWPATAGRRYDILSAGSLADPFQFRDTLTPSNSAARWTDTNAPGSARYYRIQAGP